MIRRTDVFKYHSEGRGRKDRGTVVEAMPDAEGPFHGLHTPGVAEPCREIHKDAQRVFDFTAKGNLVAVVTNGTAVLGLGDIGPLAGKPVMEGKAVLFKRFADIDVFDIELDTKDPDEIIKAVRLLEPTFGGINLEDIKAPECFYIEESLRELMKDTRLPRRSARHGHHLGGGPPECARTAGEESIQCESGHLGGPAPRGSPVRTFT